MKMWLIISCLWILMVASAEDARNKRHYPHYQYIVQQPNNEIQNRINAEFQQFYNNYEARSSEFFQKLFPRIQLSNPYPTPSGGSYQAYGTGSSSFNSDGSLSPALYTNSYPVIYQGTYGSTQQFKPVFGHQQHQFESGTAFVSNHPLPEAYFSLGSVSTSSSTSNNNPTSVIVTPPSSASASSSSTVDNSKNPLSLASSNAGVNISNKNNAEAAASSASAESSAKAEASSSASASASASAEASSTASASASPGSSSTAESEATSSKASANADASVSLASKISSLADSNAENGIFLLAVPTELDHNDASVKGNGAFKIIHLAIPAETLKKLVEESGTESATKLMSSIEGVLAAAVTEANASATATSSSGTVIKERDSFQIEKSNASTHVTDNPKPVEENKVNVTESPETTTWIPLTNEVSTGVSPNDIDLVPIDEGAFFSQFLPEHFYLHEEAELAKSLSLDKLIDQVFPINSAEAAYSINNRNNFEEASSSSGGYPTIAFKYLDTKVRDYKIQPSAGVHSNSQFGATPSNAYKYKIVSANKLINRQNAPYA